MKTKKIGNWAITKWGLEHTDKRIPYEIHKSRLWEDDWISHMAVKNWVVISEFQQALEYAQLYHAKEKK